MVKAAINAVDLPIPALYYSSTFTLPGFSTIVRDGHRHRCRVHGEHQHGAQCRGCRRNGHGDGCGPGGRRADDTAAAHDPTGLRAPGTADVGISGCRRSPMSRLALRRMPGRLGRMSAGTRRHLGGPGVCIRFYHGKDRARGPSFNGFRNQYFIGTASGCRLCHQQPTPLLRCSWRSAGMGAEAGSGSVVVERDYRATAATPSPRSPQRESSREHVDAERQTSRAMSELERRLA